MGKKLTYEDVLAEAVYTVLESLRVKHEKAILKKFQTSDVLTMDREELSDMMEMITQNQTEYIQGVQRVFYTLKNKYVDEGIYDPSGEKYKKIPIFKNDDIGEINFGI